MEKIRKGNDITVLWKIYAVSGGTEKPYDLSGRNLTLYLRSPFGKEKVQSYSIEANAIRFTFYGKDQVHTGEYTLTLVENEGRENMQTVDECKAFALVLCSCDAGGDKESKVEVTTLELRTQMQVGPVGPKGDKGDKGDQGPVGPQGPQGEPGASNTHNIGSIDLFEQIIAQKQNHNLTLEDKEAILNGKVITTSAGNGVVPTISSNSMGENGAVLIFHFNERLYEIFVMWTDTLCYINGVFSFTKETKLYADSELSETSENAVQNKVVTEKLTQLSEAKEDKKNKVTSLSDESTDVQYPSAKAVYDLITWLKERLEEQDQFIEDLYNNTIPKNADDYYPDISVGVADNLAGVDVVDSEINFRRSGGGAITDGVARIESIKGNSVVWNQFMDYGRAISNNKTMAVELVNGKISGYVKEAKPANNITFATVAPSGSYYRSIIGHKYMWVFSSNINSSRVSVGDKYDLKSGVVIEAVSNGYCYFYPFGGYSTIIEANTSVEFSAALYDLTKMFGSGNEPTTIDEFYQRIPMGVDMNAYNEGEVIHMGVQSIESVGVNQWDDSDREIGGIGTSSTGGANLDESGVWRTKGYIPVFGNTKYYIYAGGLAQQPLRARFYRADLSYITSYDASGADVKSAKEFTTRAEAAYMRMAPNEAAVPIDTPICINLSDTAVNGKYFPYIKRVEDLAVIRKYFPDGMKSVASAHDAIKYNEATQKKEKVVRIEQRTFTSAVKIQSVNSEGIINAILVDYTTDYNGMMANVVGYEKQTSGIAETTSEGWLISGSATALNALFLRLNSANVGGTTLAAVNAYIAAHPITALMVLAEPIVTELDKEDQLKDWDYSVWNDGTERAIAAGKSSAFAADITYGFNAIGKIKELESLVAALRAKVGI